MSMEQNLLGTKKENMGGGWQPVCVSLTPLNLSTLGAGGLI